MKKKNAIAKCLATKVLEGVEDKDSAIPLFLASPAQKNLFLVSLMYWNTTGIGYLLHISSCSLMSNLLMTFIV